MIDTRYQTSLTKAMKALSLTDDVRITTWFLQLREYQKDLEYRLHHRLSKFDRSNRVKRNVMLSFCIPNFKANSLFFWHLYGLVFFYLETIEVLWLDHDLTASI